MKDEQKWEEAVRKQESENERVEALGRAFRREVKGLKTVPLPKYVPQGVKKKATLIDCPNDRCRSDRTPANCENCYEQEGRTLQRDADQVIIDKLQAEIDRLETMNQRLLEESQKWFRLRNKAEAELESARNAIRFDVD